MANAPWVTPNVQFFDNSGLPLAAGKLYTYVAGSTTPQTTYTTATGSTANANPVILDSAGRANVWLQAASYRFDLKDSTGVLLWSVDNVTASALSAVTTASANTALAGPTTGGAAVPTFRALVAADIPSLSATYALATLANLGTTNINAALLFQTSLDIGSAAKPPRNLFLFGAGTYGTTSIELTGTPTAARVVTIQDATQTLVGRATTDTLTNKTLTAPVIATIVNSGTLTLPTSTDTLVGKATTDLLLNKTLQVPLTALTANGAINPNTAAWYVITKAGVLGDTLGAPTVTTDDGKIIMVTSNTANAHTITATGLFNTGSANVNLATFAAFAGAGLMLMAYQGKWNVISQIGITFS